MAIQALNIQREVGTSYFDAVSNTIMEPTQIKMKIGYCFEI